MPAAVVLGAGMVGSVVAADLASSPEYEVVIADLSRAALDVASKRAAGRVRTVEADLSDAGALGRLVDGADVVLGAMPSRFGFATLRHVIEAGRNYCDISFMPEDALALDDLARANGVTAVVDCGVAPGMSNVLAAHGASRLDEALDVEILVGGLPRERRWPFQYKAPFAPDDVIEEYTRPARVVEQGRVETREALSESELVDFPGVGTLEALVTDGLRTLVDTLSVPRMREKTLRYPGHAELMRVFRATGFFSAEPIEIAGRAVRPIDVTRALLFPHWRLREDEEELTAMRVTVTGDQDGRRTTYRWDLLDTGDRERGFTSMGRTTGFPCAIVAHLIASGAYVAPGVSPPELLAGPEGLVDTILREHESRGVRYEASVETAA